GLVYVLVAAALGTWQRGILWNASNRDGTPEPLNPYAARADRARKNFLETFVFFAAATLAVVLAGKHDTQTVLAAQIYFWARLAYLPVYIVGIPYLRTLIWAASLWGILQMLEALL
ncbi:MAG: MAPEG family protein, partial [Xanthomonadales bacterium]|nr:MAPEG family protein [Xanthomonadales bacterium]